MNRIYGLDIVRSVAILVVVFAHSTLVFSREVSISLQSVVPGDVGVSIFFVLSGYLIGGILLKNIEGDFSWRDLGQFWIRRWFRTLPNYFLVLVFLVVFDLVIYKTDPGFSFKYLFFMQNLLPEKFVLFPEAWSLSVEEWFYLSFPLLCFLGFKLIANRKHVILILAIFFLVVPLLLRLVVYLTGDTEQQQLVPFIVIYRLDGLMYGILGAYIHKYNSPLWERMKHSSLFVAGVLLVLTSVVNKFFPDLPYWMVISSSLHGVMTLAALPYFSLLTTGKNVTMVRIFTFISTISYAMYVLNLSVIQYRFVPGVMAVSGLRELTGEYSAIASLVLFWISTIGGAWLLYRFFEKPMTDLRDRIVISDSPEQVIPRTN